jgi:uncharacterized protein YkwD
MSILDWFRRWRRTIDKTTEIYYDKELLELHNEFRVRRGVNISKLSLNEKLRLAAVKHAVWMAETSTLSHTGKNNTSPWDRMLAEGYRYKTGAENIAYSGRTVHDVFDGWVDSRGHRINILNPAIKEVGFGVARNDRTGYTYYCVVFGSQ